MYNHEPKNYFCPLCMIVAGREKEGYTRQADVFYRDKNLTAFIGLFRWPNNQGNSVIVPNTHIENIYDMPEELLGAIAGLSKKVARAYKAVVGCDGVSLRQHNEPAGNQDVWHYHQHVIPRWQGDRLYPLYKEKAMASEGERAEYADKLRQYFRKVNGGR